MSRYTLFAVIAALCLATSNATVTTQSLASTQFAFAPGVVIQGATGQADVSTWGSYQQVIYGPGTVNTTAYAYGIKGSAPITAIASRTLNATKLNNGTTATASTDAMVASDVVSGTLSIASGYKYAVGLGSFAIAYVATDTSVTPNCPQVYLSVYNGGTATAVTTTKVTTNTCAYCVAQANGQNGIGFALKVNNVFYENSTYYVAYTSATYTATATATTSTPCAATTAALPAGTLTTDTDTVTLVGVLQGYSAGTTATAKWTTAPNWFSQGASNAPAITYANLAGMCGPQNYTNSTTFYCAYTNGASAPTLSYVAITVSSGSAGSASTLATSTATSGTAAQTTKTYSVAGFLHSEYQQGILLNLLTTTYTSGPTASSYANTLQLYNFTSGASSTTGATDGGIAITGFSNTVTPTNGGTYTGDGVTYGLGFGIIASYASDSSTTNYQLAAFLANGTANGSAPTSFSTGAAGQANAYIDANGALWAGSYSVDSTSGIQTGWLGNLVGQLYYSAGNVLASFFALISVMIAALFAF